jgi:hypothetical protein
MSDTSPVLSLPLIQPAQAQKHVTHNEALLLLDAVVQLAVEDRDRADPPAQPAPGQRHIVPSWATGGWAGETGKVAVWDGVTWNFVAPAAGWRAEVLAENLSVVFDGSDWQSRGVDLEDLDGIGIGTSSDATNRLAVSSDATLLTHAGGGHQLKLNKAGSGDTGSLLYQTDWSGRAEMGLNGSDAWSIKVSPDGAAWTTALELDPETGAAGGAAVQSDVVDATHGRLMQTGAFGLGSGGQSGHLQTYADAGGVSQIIADGVTGEPTDKPKAGRGHVGAHLAASASRWMQILAEVAGGSDAARLWFRRCYNGSVSVWQEIFSQGNVLGTVSQENGMPTGALIERGSNADGQYDRWADGTQICWRRRGPGSDTVMTWTFPAEFVNANTAVVVTQCDTELFPIGFVCGLPSTQNVQIASYSMGSGNAVAADWSAIAIGRWF